MSRLKDVDDDWILRRLERWGQSSRMPFLGPEKAKIIQDIMQDVRPMVVVEVGTMCGYSAIKLAQALPPGAAHILLHVHLMIAHAATETSTSQASPGSDTYETSHSMLRVHCMLLRLVSLVLESMFVSWHLTQLCVSDTECGGHHHSARL
jgi:hypothetical protein